MHAGQVLYHLSHSTILRIPFFDYLVNLTSRELYIEIFKEGSRFFLQGLNKYVKFGISDIIGQNFFHSLGIYLDHS
jgi:hypothetical protein